MSLKEERDKAFKEDCQTRWQYGIGASKEKSMARSIFNAGYLAGYLEAMGKTVLTSQPSSRQLLAKIQEELGDI